MSYKTITDKQTAFLKVKDKRLNFLTGSVRSGKTWVSLLKFVWFITQCPPEYEFLLCGKTITSLKRNCFGYLNELCGDYFSYTISTKEGWLFGRKIYIEGANDERSEHKIRGMTLGGAYCDEITIFPETFVNMLLSRLSKPGAKLYATANPDRPTHYIKESFIDNPKLDIADWRFTIDDNTFLDPEYVAQLKREYTGVFYERYILGNWVQAEGAIYRIFSDNEQDYYVEYDAVDKRFVINGEPVHLNTVNIGVDWGGNKSGHAFTATGISKDYRYVFILVSEWHSATGTTPDEVCNAVARFANRIQKQYGQVDDIYADSAEQLLLNLLREKINIPVRNSLKREVIDRIRFTTSLMAQKRLYMTRDCQNVADFFKNAVYDSKALSDKRLDDGSYDVDSGDAWEYSIERYMNYIIRE